MRRPLILLLLTATALGGLSSCSSGRRSAGTAAVTPPPAALVANATLLWVIDGDTIDATVDGRRQRVRLIGIDTPETKKENTPVECYGPEATAFAQSLLPKGTALYLERDVVGRDDYGRLLAYVYRADDRVFINSEMVRQGFARLLTVPPNVSHVDDFIAVNREARTAKRGLWGACPAVSRG